MRPRTQQNGAPRSVGIAFGALLVVAVLGAAVSAAAQDAPARRGPAQGKVDLNSATLEQMLALPIPEAAARALHDHRTYVRYFTDLFDIAEVDGVTPEVIATLRPLVAVLPPPEGDQAIARMTASFRQVRSYLDQEGSNEGLVDDYLDLLQEPWNVNQLDLFDLMSFQNVSPVDAASILASRQRLGGFSDARQLRRSDGLNYYAFRNIRDFVVYDDRHLEGDQRVRGDYQLRYYDTPLYTGDDDNLQIVLLGLKSGVQLLNPAMSHKLRVIIPGGMRAGARTYRALGEENWDETAKGFFEVRRLDLGALHVKRAVVGHYRAAFGLGLIMDNTDFIHFRKTGYGWNKRPLGIRSDLSLTHQYALQGAAVEARSGNVHVAAFVSSTERDGIVNPDSTINRYVTMNPRLPQGVIDEIAEERGIPSGLRRNAFREDLLGANVKYMLGHGTYVGLTGLHLGYDRGFDPRPSTLISGGVNSQYWEARDAEIAAGYRSIFDDPAAGTRTEYRWRRIYGAEAQAIVGNVALQGEYARLQDPRAGFLGGDSPQAWITNAYAQWENLTLLAIYRDYDIDFDNPYQRSFSNDSKYEQTILDSSFRLEDDLYSWLSSDNPQPKGERGLFLDMRYRISRQFIINGLQFDQWERKADAAEMLRYTARLEYQPKFNLRFRLRHRLSSRTDQNPEDVRSFTSWENRVQMIALLSNYNRLMLSYVQANVNFVARQRLAWPADPADGTLSAVGSASSPAYAFEARYEHNLTPWLRMTVATSVYDGFFWNFEGTEFVLLDDLGFRNWVQIESRVSERMLMQLKMTKDHGLPGTYYDVRRFGEAVPPTPDVTYVPKDDLFIRLQIDYSF